MHGVVARQDGAGQWQLDERRGHARQARRPARRAPAQSLPAEQWWREERKAVEARDFVPEVTEMYGQSLSFAKFRDEFTRFWQLPGRFFLRGGMSHERLTTPSARELIRQLVDGTIDQDNTERLLKMPRKDKARFFNYIAVLQERVKWSERILLRIGRSASTSSPRRRACAS